MPATGQLPQLRWSPTARTPSQRPRQRRPLIRRLTTLSSPALVVFTTILPLAALVRAGVEPATLHRYVEFVASSADLRTLRNTVLLGLLVAATGTSLGFAFALLQVGAATRGRQLLHLVTLLPIVSAPAAMATAVLALFGPRGLVTHRMLGSDIDISGLPGLIIVQSLSLFPVAYLSLTGKLRQHSPSLDGVAAVLGATRWQRFRFVLLPAVAPRLITAFVLIFVDSIADLVNPLVLGGDYHVLTSAAYQAIASYYDTRSAVVYGLILLIPTIGLSLALRRDLRREVYPRNPAVTPSRAGEVVAGWTRRALTVVVMAVTAFSVSLWLTGIAGAFTEIFGIDDRPTLDHIREVLTGPDSSCVLTSTLLAAAAAPIAVAAGLHIARLLAHRTSAWRNGVYIAAVVGSALPGAVLGVGYVLAFGTDIHVGHVRILPQLAGSTAILGGIGAILLAFIARSIRAGLTGGADALTDLHPFVREAATLPSSRPLMTLRWVMVPLIGPTVLRTLVLCFAQCMTSTATILFLVTPSTKTITSQILVAARTERYELALAYCTTLTGTLLIVITAIYLIASIARRRPRIPARNMGM